MTKPQTTPQIADQNKGIKTSRLKCAGHTTRMSRRVYFSSAHRYYQVAWSLEKNREEFGKCFSEFGHGHNYILEAYFSGEIETQSGLIVNLIDVDMLLKRVTIELDHQHLNFNHPHFKDLVPTTENIAAYLFNQILCETPKLMVPNLQLYKIKLFEDEDLWVEIAL